MSCKLSMCLWLHLPCSPRRSSLHSDNQMTCPGTQSTACRHEEEEAGRESWAPSPLSWCSGSPPLQRQRKKRETLKASYYIRTSCLHKFLKSLKLSWRLIQQLIKRVVNKQPPTPCRPPLGARRQAQRQTFLREKGGEGGHCWLTGT